MTEPGRASKVRKLLRDLVAPSYKDETREELRAQEVARRAEADTNNYTLPAEWGSPEGQAAYKKQAAAGAPADASDASDDGLLMDAPKKPKAKKKKPSKQAGTGSDAPVDVNGEY